MILVSKSFAICNRKAYGKNLLYLLRGANFSAYNCVNKLLTRHTTNETPNIKLHVMIICYLITLSAVPTLDDKRRRFTFTLSPTQVLTGRDVILRR